MFCACEAIQFFSAVLCVVTDAHKFEVRLAISETPEKCRPVGKVHAVILKFLKGSTRFPPTVVGCVKGIHPRCAGQLHFLESETVLAPSSRWVIKPWERERRYGNRIMALGESMSRPWFTSHHPYCISLTRFDHLAR